MIVWAYDTETALIRPGRAAPELACVSFASSEGHEGLLHWTDPNAYDFLKDIYRWAAAGKATVVGHNLAFDSAVTCANFPDLMPIVRSAYRAGGCRDTMLRQELLDISVGVFRGYYNVHTDEWCRHDYNLAALVRRAGLPGILDLNKDVWRLSFGQLRDLPLEEWPQGAKDYAQLDAVATLGCYMAQGDRFVPDELDEARAFFSLQLASVWGLRTDPDKVRALDEETRQRLAEIRGKLVVSGLVREDGSRDTKAAQARIQLAWEAAGKKPRRTKTGLFCLDEDSCEACGDDLMEDYALFTTLGKMLSSDVKLLTAASHLPVHPGFKLLGTCRVASRRQQDMPGGNVQNLSRGNRKRCPTCGGTGHATEIA